MPTSIRFGPAIEQSGLWGDFHHVFLVTLREHLGRELPSRYLVTIEERVYVAWEVPPVTELFLEVRTVEGRLVAVVELLSPNNKRAGHDGREAYLHKRGKVLQSAAHLIEMDLLIDGQRMPLAHAWPAGDYHVLVARGDRRPQAEVYSWSAGETLPVIAFPLVPPDADLPVALQPVLETTWERGNYDRLLERTRARGTG